MTHNAQILSANNESAQKGVWEPIRFSFKGLPVHMALLHTGKVLAFAGSGNDEHSFENPHPAELWDPQTDEAKTIDQRLAGDLFCVGQAFLPDGRLIAAGGTYKYDGNLFGLPIPPFRGLNHTYIFDPLLERWTRVQDMANGRWYPTLVTLGDGRVLAVAGLTEGLPWVFLRSIEIYTPGIGWKKLEGADRWLPLYPRLHLLPGGDVFYSGSYNTHYTFPFVLKAFPTAILNVRERKWKTIGPPTKSEREEGACVLLPLTPPEYKAKVLLAGGGTPGGRKAIPNAELIDLSEDYPKWRRIEGMNHPRYYAYAVILPDRRVFVMGGRKGTIERHAPMAPMVEKEECEEREHDIPQDLLAVREAEIFDPETRAWTEVARMQVDRLYHSNALLLPDGRVVAAGSNPSRRVNELRIEIYRPPYLFKGERPLITNYPTHVEYGQVFEIETPSAKDIESVALMRPSAVTHCVDTEQRYVGLEFDSKNSERITIEAPVNPNLAPPGYYMLFVVTRELVPSKGKFVHVL